MTNETIDFIRLDKAGPTSRPPSGAFDVRVKRDTSGTLVRVSSDGTEKYIPTVPAYADQTAANAALAANVLYYNEDTGLFQITTA